MNRRSFLGLPLAAALAKQVMGAEKPRATLTAIEPMGEIGVAGRTYCEVTDLYFDEWLEFGPPGSPRYKCLRISPARNQNKV